MGKCNQAPSLWTCRPQVASTSGSSRICRGLGGAEQGAEGGHFSLHGEGDGKTSGKGYL
jgi:hypothetical protein